MRDLLAIHAMAMDEFGRRVRAVQPEQWGAATPCTDWDVRTLVNHLVYEQLWVPPLLDGATVAEVGDRFDGDQLGDDPVAAWQAAAAGARQALTAPGAIDRTVHLSYGDIPASRYCIELVSDLTVHAWDLARGIRADDRLDPEAVAMTYEWATEHADELAKSGLFDPPVLVPDGADTQTALIALSGRDPSWRAGGP
jgi:uncharacterized protein (TIGR03086 family)